MLSNLFGDQIAQLNRHRITRGGNFHLRYAWRNDIGRRSPGLSGIEFPNLLDQYDESLERAYEFLVKGGWTKPDPHASVNAVPVLVFQVGLRNDPGTLTIRNRSTILLRSQIPEPSLQAVFERASVEAAHETAHTFTHVHHPPLETDVDHWRWFDEATAVLVERHVYPLLSESARYGIQWAYQPERALNQTVSDGGGYFAAFFLEYIARRCGMDLIRNTWKATDVQGPIEAMDRLLQESHKMSFGNVFRDYVIDAFHYQSIAADVHYRFRDRTITQWFDLSTSPQSTPADTPERLRPFACRYYRFDTPTKVGRLKLTLTSLQPPPDSALVAEVVIVNDDRQFVCRRKPLKPPKNGSVGENAVLEAEMSLKQRGSHYAVLVVANVPEPRDDVLFDFFADRRYSLSAEIV